MASETWFSKAGLRETNSDVENLAGYALVALATGSLDKNADRCRPEVEELLSALTKPDDTIYQQLLLKMIADGSTSDHLIDHAIPDLARQLGDEWSADDLSFADVTIGISRLQQTVRRHGARKEIDGLKLPLGQRVLLILPESEQHSLGIFIVANQMRRLGVWVQLALDCKLDQIAPLIKDQDFATIGVTIGRSQTRKQILNWSNTIRETGTDAPIVLGGAAFTEDANGLAQDFGADFIAKNTREALDFCQIDTARTASLPFELATL